MEPWVADVLKGLAGGITGLVGSWFLFRVQRKAASTEHEFGVSDRWQGWAVKLEGRVGELEKRVAHLEGENTRLKRLLDVALRVVESLLSLLQAAGISVPPLPEVIDRLLEKRAREGGGV